jgi:CIC family chloride channel protein
MHALLVDTRCGLVGLALIVGAGAGLGAVVFRFLIVGITDLVTGRADFSAAGRVASLHVPALGPWFLLLAPVVGGLLYGPLVHRFAPEARGHGVPEVMVAVARNRGRIPARVAAVKSLASALCIGTGGSVGREGPIVQIGSALGSSVGQWLRVPDHRLRLLVACGAAGGISATFNAPIAGVFFALEIILRGFTAEAFGVVAISSVTANVVARALVGNDHIIELPAYPLGSAGEFPLYALLGLLAGVIGWGFAGRYAAGFLLLLLVGKMLATSLTIGIGGSGGVFAPSLFVGGMAGTAFGIAAGALFPGLDLSPGAFGLVGMAAVFAAASHAPIAAVVIVFELTGQYSVILPLMATVALATGVSHLISRDTVYTRKLLRRGIDIDAEARAEDAGRGLTVAEAMGAVPDPVATDDGLTDLAATDDGLADLAATDDGLADLAARLGTARYGALPVHDAGGHYRGAVPAVAVGPTRPTEGKAVDVAVPLPELDPGDSLRSALRALADHEETGLPVRRGADGPLLGWLDHRDNLTAYRRALPRIAPPPPPAPPRARSPHTG